ncbi:hypothetical protein B0T10DRAFT_603749 [Thelonectria olida]|uniref:Uncharacterized protein n=1 Tax=Thelonectria olida TaxID=1576542 RepID=A0A9P8WAH2_9HYPO|nr:hypothetical protein B0T10DRAFT_603749 [Thelonectria olida]
MPEGRESPSPSRQSGKQIHDPPASGHGINKTDTSNPEAQLEHLESNPNPHIMDHAREKMFAKTERENK